MHMKPDMSRGMNTRGSKRQGDECKWKRQKLKQGKHRGGDMTRTMGEWRENVVGAHQWKGVEVMLIIKAWCGKYDKTKTMTGIKSEKNL